MVMVASGDSNNPTDVVERAKAALEGVTDGPWSWTHGMDARAMVLGPDDLVVKLEGYTDAAFIAAARTLIPELVSSLEASRAQLRMALDQIDRLKYDNRSGVVR